MNRPVLEPGAALQEIHGILSGREWTADTAGEIACILEQAGFIIQPYDPEEGNDHA